MTTERSKQLVNNNGHEVTFDMRFHAFVLALPRRGAAGVGEPAIVMNGGDEATLVYALRVIADEIEQRNTDVFPLQ